jgi:hypothetical protein
MEEEGANEDLLLTDDVCEVVFARAPLVVDEHRR